MEPNRTQHDDTAATGKGTLMRLMRQRDPATNRPAKSRFRRDTILGYRIMELLAIAEDMCCEQEAVEVIVEGNEISLLP